MNSLDRKAREAYKKLCINESNKQAFVCSLNKFSYLNMIPRNIIVDVLKLNGFKTNMLYCSFCNGLFVNDPGFIYRGTCELCSNLIISTKFSPYST